MFRTTLLSGRQTLRNSCKKRGMGVYTTSGGGTVLHNCCCAVLSDKVVELVGKKLNLETVEPSIERVVCFFPRAGVRHG